MHLIKNISLLSKVMKSACTGWFIRERVIHEKQGEIKDFSNVLKSSLGLTACIFQMPPVHRINSYSKSRHF